MAAPIMFVTEIFTDCKEDQLNAAIIAANRTVKPASSPTAMYNPTLVSHSCAFDSSTKISV